MLTVRKKALTVSAAALTAGGVYVLTDDKRRREAQLTLASTYRVMNLASTVAIMCGDYGIDSMYGSKAKASEYDAKYNELCKLQSDLEELHRQQFDQYEVNKTNGSTPSVDPWLIKIDENAKVMDKVALELVALSEQKEHVRHDLHQRNAKRLTKMCSENGGLYIKLGQHIAMLDYIVPIEYQTELFSLLGTTPQSSIDSVRSVIKSELGAFPDELFDTFDPVPIASASLAQVHIATKNGVKYAVKVQHDGLAESAAFDMLVITNLVALVPHIFKEFNYNWLSAEMNRNVPLELDFRVERENILKTTKMLKKYIDSGEVAVPTVLDAYSATKVLTMSFEEGCYVSNKRQIEAWGLSKAHIAHTISTVFWDQIFKDGFVHCDPHEANLLVRPNPRNPAKPQIVLLDHGLYRQLDDQFRKDYCRLWQGIVFADKDQIEHFCKQMNAGPAYPLLASMITQRSWDDIVSEDIDRLRTKGRASDSTILKAYIEKYMVQIMQLLGVVPSDLLLLFKTSDCLRHLDLLLESDLNTSAVAASVVAEVLLKEDINSSYKTLNESYYNSLALYLIAYTNYYGIQTRLTGYYLLGWVNLVS
eukprot:gene8064-9611_t